MGYLVSFIISSVVLIIATICVRDSGVIEACAKYGNAHLTGTTIICSVKQEVRDGK